VPLARFLDGDFGRCSDRQTPGSTVLAILRDEASSATGSQPEAKSWQVVVKENLVGFTVR
jgi:hypothetical protein